MSVYVVLLYYVHISPQCLVTCNVTFIVGQKFLSGFPRPSLIPKIFCRRGSMNLVGIVLENSDTSRQQIKCVLILSKITSYLCVYIYIYISLMGFFHKVNLRHIQCFNTEGEVPWDLSPPPEFLLKYCVLINIQILASTKCNHSFL